MVFGFVGGCPPGSGWGVGGSVISHFGSSRFCLKVCPSSSLTFPGRQPRPSISPGPASSLGWRHGFRGAPSQSGAVAGPSSSRGEPSEAGIGEPLSLCAWSRWRCRSEERSLAGIGPDEPNTTTTGVSGQKGVVYNYLEAQVEGLRAEVSHLKSKLQATRLRASPAAAPFPQPQEPAPNRHVEAWVRLVIN